MDWEAGWVVLEFRHLQPNGHATALHQVHPEQ